MNGVRTWETVAFIKRFKYGLKGWYENPEESSLQRWKVRITKEIKGNLRLNRSKESIIPVIDFIFFEW